MSEWFNGREWYCVLYSYNYKLLCIVLQLLELKFDSTIVEKLNIENIVEKYPFSAVQHLSHALIQYCVLYNNQASFIVV